MMEIENIIRKIFGLTKSGSIEWYRRKGVKMGDNFDIISSQIDLLCPSISVQ